MNSASEVSYFLQICAEYENVIGKECDFIIAERLFIVKNIAITKHSYITYNM